MTTLRSNNEHANGENCVGRIPVMEFTGFGKAYVPAQELCEMYAAKDGFVRGTLFPELDIPYEPRWNVESKGGEVIE